MYNIHVCLCVCVCVFSLVAACLLERVIRVYRREHGGAEKGTWRAELAREWLDMMEEEGRGSAADSASKASTSVSSTGGVSSRDREQLPFSKLFWQLCEVTSLLIRYQELQGTAVQRKEGFAEVYEW